MRSKMIENSKVAKSAKTKLSDLRPKKEARGGAIPETGPYFYKKTASGSRRRLITTL